MATAIFELGNIQVDQLTEPAGGPTSTFGDPVTTPGIDTPGASVFNIATTNATGINIGHTGLSTYVYGTSLFIGQNLDTISSSSMYIGGTNATDVYINSGVNFRVLGDGYFTGNLIVDGYTFDLGAGAASGQILQYDGTKWIAGVLNGTGIFPGNIDAYQVAYASGTNTLTGDSNLVFDGYHLGIGATASTYPIEIYGDGYLASRLIINASSAAISPSGTGAIRFNTANNHLEFSENAGPWTVFGSGGGGGSMQIGLPVVGGTPNDVLYVDGSGNLAQSNNFTTDGTNVTVAHHISIDGYTIDISAGATTNKALVYNGTSFVAANIANSVSNSDSTLTISPTTGAVVASLNLGHANTWTADQTFQNIKVSANNTYSLGDSTNKLKDGYFAGKISLDGYTLDLTAGATNNQALVYNGTSFVAGTINSLAVGNTVTGGTSGSVLFVDSSSHLAQDNTNFFWDASNHRLGIGINPPTQALDVRGNIYSLTNAGALGVYNSGTEGGEINIGGHGVTTFGETNSWSIDVDSSNNLRHFWNGGSSALTIDTSNNIKLGNTSTSGSVLYVNSSGNLAQDNSNFFWDATNHRLGIGTTAPLTQFDIKSTVTGNDPRINVNSTTTDAGYIGYQFSNASAFKGGFFRLKSTDEISIWNPTAAILKGDTSGNWTPQSDNGQDFGASGTRWRTFYGVSHDSGSASMLLKTSATTAITIDTSQRVGIGPSPSYILDIQKSVADYLVNFRNTSTSGYSAIQLQDSSGTARGSLGYANASAGIANAQSRIYLNRISTDVAILDSGSFNFLLGANGNITIGGSAVNATYKFEITGTSNLSLAQSAASSGSPTMYQFAGGAHTTLASGTEAIDGYYKLDRTVQFTGSATPGAANIATQRAMYVSAPTYAFSSTGAQTITTAATLAVKAAPSAGTNATITNAYSIWAQAGVAAFDGHIKVDGYTINLSGGATTGQVLTYNGTNVVASNPTVANVSNVKEQQITTTSATDVINYTTTAAGNYRVWCYYRVTTATTNLTINITWTDVTGAQSQSLVFTATPTAVGSYTTDPVFLNATNASAIKLTVTAGTANQVFVSANVEALT